MNGKVLNKKIPTIFGVILLLGGLAAGIWLVGGEGLNFLTKAGPTAVPKNVKVVNKGPNSFTVSWTTDVPVTGLVRYSQDPTKIKTPAGDTRDQLAGNTSDFTTHYVDIGSLMPDKIYYFVIVSGSAEYNDGGSPYQIKTTAAGKGEEDVVYGKVVNSSGQAVGGSMVYVEIDGSDTLGAITANDGGWRINMGNARNKQGQLLTYDKQKQRLSIFVQGGGSGTATAITTLAQAKPTNNIVMGQAQNFLTEAGGTITPLTSGTGTNTGPGFGTTASQIPSGAPIEEVKLVNPQTDNEQIATTKPELRGQAPAGTAITITVHSAEAQTTQISADGNGNFSWTPPNDLEPGSHTVTLEYKDKSGILQQITRSFVVLAADQTNGLPAYTATPSATPIITVTPIPTEIVLPETTMPSTETGVPASGSLTPTLTLTIVGLGLFVGGLIWRRKIVEIYG